MTRSKYQVPASALAAVRQFMAESPGDWSTETVLQAFIKYQSENPPVPTEDQMTDLGVNVGGDTHYERQKLIAVEWIKRMYLASKPRDGQRSFSTPFGIFEIDDRVPPGEIRLHQWDGPTLVRNVGSETSASEPELKVPEAVKDLMHVDSSQGSSNDWNQVVLTAFRRGQNNPELPQSILESREIEAHNARCAEFLKNETALKKQFESHSHTFNSPPVLPVSTFNETCEVCGVSTTRADTACCHFTTSGKVMRGHLNVKP